MNILTLFSKFSHKQFKNKNCKTIISLAVPPKVINIISLLPKSLATVKDVVNKTPAAGILKEERSGNF